MGKELFWASLAIFSVGVLLISAGFSRRDSGWGIALLWLGAACMLGGWRVLSVTGSEAGKVTSEPRCGMLLEIVANAGLQAAFGAEPAVQSVKATVIALVEQVVGR